MATKGGGYMVVYKTSTFFYSGHSLSDGKDQLFSAKVWNFGTTFLNSLANICMVTYSLHIHVLINTQLWDILGAFSLSDGIQANLSAKV